MSVSIREIARLAGVSRGTVDRALNNRPGINPQIKQQILRIADEVGYRSNRAGRMLGLRKKPLTLGVQMPADGNDFFLDVSEGLEEAAAEFADAGLSLRIETMKGYSVERQLAQLNSLLDSGVNGLAFVPIDQPPIRSFMQKLARQD
ncbi:MAG: LacI family DNA-binding transcriptional regulator, partial [Eubacteriales bacterium]|nr:LacI family DNA-binding transcriptional regulator [Eubacteriales bacterium]